MTVRLTDLAILLEGSCPVEDAEPLLAALQAQASLPVDLSGCTHIHMAVVQILLAADVTVIGDAPPVFVGRWVVPLLTRGHGRDDVGAGAAGP